MPDSAPEPDDFICFAIYSVGHAFNQVYKPLLDELGLTYPQYLVMVALWARDDRTVGGLGSTLFLESSTLTPLLKRLERLGFVARMRDPSDERQVRIRLTPDGAALRERAAGFPACIDGATGLPPGELGALRAAILKMREALQKAAGRARPC